MLLQGAPGYYSEEYELEGSKFRLRELTDDELVAYINSSEEQGQAAMAIVKAATQEGALQPDGEQAVSSVKAARGVVNAVVQAAVVGWDLTDPCTPENVILLPLRVRRLLTTRIVAISSLGKDEVPFSAK